MYENTYRSGYASFISDDITNFFLLGSCMTFSHFVHSVKSPVHLYPVPELYTSCPLHFGHGFKAPKQIASDKRSIIYTTNILII